MGKTIFVLSASPRKGGNSDLLCDRFMEGAAEQGHLMEKIYVADKKIKYCTGCLTCYLHGKPCPLKDDMAGILEKMIAADVIVMASPVYFYSISARMKALLERTFERYHEIVDKEFYFILSAEDSNELSRTRPIEEFRSYIYCMAGARECGYLLYLGIPQKGSVAGTSAMHRAYEMGQGV